MSSLVNKEGRIMYMERAGWQNALSGESSVNDGKAEWCIG